MFEIIKIYIQKYILIQSYTVGIFCKEENREIETGETLVQICCILIHLGSVPDHPAKCKGLKDVCVKAPVSIICLA